MSKKIIYVVIAVLLIAVLGIFLMNDNSGFNKLKKEYESLNGQKNDNGKKYPEVKLENSNVKIIYASYDQVFNVLKKDGIIYFGFPTCPWCRNALPSLIKAADEAGVKEIYYMDNKDDRDIKTLEDGKIKEEKKASNDYEKLLKELGDKVSVYEGLNDDSIKRLYYPTVVVVKEGKITDYIEGTVDSQKDPYKPLTKDEQKELVKKYENAFATKNMCDLDSKC